MKVVYDWLAEYVGDHTPPLEKIEELFTFHAFEVDGIEKVGNHDVLDVKVLPDRSSDCLSHRGIARELSALLDVPLAKDPFAHEALLEPKTDKIEVTLEDVHSCGRFAAALVTGVTIGESPRWLQERLHALGQRSINNIVDATNYVMLALGQPLHAYDAEKLAHPDGKWHMGVRMARIGEEITTLSHETLALTDSVQLIVDAHANTPLGVAGIKGGTHAEIDAHTSSIILEAAHFNPQVTRRASQFLKLQTDASRRFENNISPELIPYALADVVALILDIAGGTNEGFVDIYPHPQKSTPVLVSHTHIQALLGITIPSETIERIFSRLGFLHTVHGEGWLVTAPFERTDITIAEDLIAEVGRVFGYEHIHSVVPERLPLTEYNARHYYSEKLRTMLVGEGFSEVITSSFQKKDDIELQNALATDKRYVRSALRENIRETLNRNIFNVDILGITRVQIFEIGTVFYKTEDGRDVTEHMSIALGVRTKQQGTSPKDNERLADILPKVIAILGDSFQATIADGMLEINLTQALSLLPKPTGYDADVTVEAKTFVPFSPYPFISRDIAVWVPEHVEAHAIEVLIREHAGPLLVRVTLFDEFKKDDKVSYAFRLVFQSFERTLTYEEITPVMETLSDAMKNSGFEVR